MVSLLYKATRKLLSILPVLLHSKAATDAELLVVRLTVAGNLPGHARHSARLAPQVHRGKVELRCPATHRTPANSSCAQGAGASTVWQILHTAGTDPTRRAEEMSAGPVPK
jgi:hypothetical protein